MPRIRSFPTSRISRSCGHLGKGPAAAVKVKVLTRPPPSKSRLLTLLRPRSCLIQLSRHLKRSIVWLPPTLRKPSSRCRRGQVQLTIVKVKVTLLLPLRPHSGSRTRSRYLIVPRIRSIPTPWMLRPHGPPGSVFDAAVKAKAPLLASRSSRSNLQILSRLRWLPPLSRVLPVRDREIQGKG